MSIKGAIAGPSSHNPPFFNDVHSTLQNLMGELSRLRDGVDANEIIHQQACEKVRKDIEKEAEESRETMNLFRYEFDELVHKRVETVVEGLEEMEQSQRFKDRHQQKQIDLLETEVRKLVVNLGGVNKHWTTLRHNCADKTRIMSERQQKEKPAAPSPATRTGTGRRRSSLKETINTIQREKSEDETYVLADTMRARLKGAGQFLRGEDWDRVFREQDKDGSGTINFSEFRIMCRVKLKLQEPDRVLRVVFESLDQDGSGGISISELIEFVADPSERMRTRLKRAVRETGNDWRKVVREHDLDNSGQISLTEFKRLCHQKLKMLDKDVHLSAVFKSLDTDGSGEVSIRELTAWVEGRR